ncbi:MAG: hypothetical protein HON70_17060, partial [Lentisphaerae bacterium]|nr:hypothetical protein [Lentisphaerota bacterium]
MPPRIRKHLFIDDRLVGSCKGLSRRVHPATKRGPVVLPDAPWEEGRVGFYGSILDVDERLHMWYWAQTPRHNGTWERGLALAVSDDGMAWTKPRLGVQERCGSRDNNLVDTFGDTVSLNPNGGPDDRFVLLRPLHREEPDRGGLYVALSGDGIHWRPQEQRLFPFIPDTQNQVQFDQRLAKWVAYVRTWTPNRCVGRIEIDDLLSPWPFTDNLPPYHIWGPEFAAVPGDEIPVVFRASPDIDGPETDVYTPVVVEYPWADDVYMMFPSMYAHLPPPGRGGKYGNDGHLDVHLALSRDGITWDRPDSRPYLPLGCDGEADSCMLYMFAGTARRGDLILHYYCGYRSTHGAHPDGAEFEPGAICLATQRLDGFVSMSAGTDTGSLLTLPMIISGERLELNMATAASGSCRVEIVEATGAAIPGFALSDCEPLVGNAVHTPVRWRGSDGGLRGLNSVPVRLRFELRNADLFA